MLVAASRMLVVYAGPPTILCGAAGKLPSNPMQRKGLQFTSRSWERGRGVEGGGKSELRSDRKKREKYNKEMTVGKEQREEREQKI
jgi:hypothetical protein